MTGDRQPLTALQWLSVACGAQVTSVRHDRKQSCRCRRTWILRVVWANRPPFHILLGTTDQVADPQHLVAVLVTLGRDPCWGMSERGARKYLRMLGLALNARP